MATRPAERSPTAYARIAGLLYLGTLIVNLYGGLYVDASLIVPGDAATTANNILTSQGLFRSGIASFLLGQLFFVGYVLALYKILKPVGKDQAVLMIVLALIAVPIGFINTLNQFAALLLSSGADYLRGIDAAQLHAQVMLFLDMYRYGFSIAGILWGLWLFPLGYLVYRSGFLPKILGILVIIGCFGYVIDSLTNILLPSYRDVVSQIVLVPNLISEFALFMWLLIKGVNIKEWEDRALEAAST